MSRAVISGVDFKRTVVAAFASAALMVTSMSAVEHASANKPMQLGYGNSGSQLGSKSELSATKASVAEAEKAIREAQGELKTARLNADQARLWAEHVEKGAYTSVEKAAARENAAAWSRYVGHLESVIVKARNVISGTPVVQAPSYMQSTAATPESMTTAEAAATARGGRGDVVNHATRAAQNNQPANTNAPSAASSASAAEVQAAEAALTKAQEAAKAAESALANANKTFDQAPSFLKAAKEAERTQAAAEAALAAERVTAAERALLVLKEGSKAKGGGGIGKAVAAGVALAVVVYAVKTELDEHPDKTAGQVLDNKIAETIRENGGGGKGLAAAMASGIVEFAASYDPRNIVNSVKNRDVGGVIDEAANQWGFTGTLIHELTDSDTDTIANKQGTPAVKDVAPAAAPGREVGPAPAAPAVPGGDVVSVVPGAPGAGDVAPGGGSSVKDRGVDAGSVKQGDSGGSSGNKSYSASEGTMTVTYEDDDEGTETQTRDGSYSQASSIEERSGDQKDGGSDGKDDDKGGLVNPVDDSVGGVGGDRANVLLDRQGLVGAVGDLVSLISTQNGLDLVDLVADWDDSGGSESPRGPKGGFLAVLDGLLGSALENKDSGMARSGVVGLADLVADWGDGTGPNDGGGPGDGGPGAPGGLVSNNEGDGTDGSKPTVGPKGGSKDGGQRVASNRTTTAGSRTVQSNRTVTTTTQQKSVAVKAPTAPQSQKLAAPQAPTAVANTGPATQLQSPATKLSSPSNTTNQIQNPTTQAGHSE